MVVFTCNHCGDSLHKPKVFKHYQFQCRNSIFLSCCDCHKDFGEDFVEHTKCVTENERYGGPNYIPKPSSNKGERKQNAWINVVQNLLSDSKDLSPAERKMLQSLVSYKNIPRKKSKFLNFIKSSFSNRFNIQLVDSVWTKMEVAFKEATTDKKDDKHDIHNNGKFGNGDIIIENQNNENMCKENVNDGNQKNVKVVQNIQKATNKESVESENIKRESKKMKMDYEIICNNGLEIGKIEHEKKGKKRNREKSEDTHSENREQNSQTERINNKKSKQIEEQDKIKVIENCQTQTDKEISKFSWKDAILEIVKAKEEISLKKLRKKVINLYMEQYPEIKSRENAISKFEKKITKVNGISIQNNTVKLI